MNKKGIKNIKKKSIHKDLTLMQLVWMKSKKDILAVLFFIIIVLVIFIYQSIVGII